MKNLKFLIMGVLMAVLLLAVPNLVQAETNITVTKQVTSNNGSITFVFKGLTLDTTKEYNFLIGKTSGENPTELHLITDYTATSATIELNSATKDIYEVLTQSNKAFIKIQDTEGNVVLDTYEVDTTLPLMQALEFEFSTWLTITAPYDKYDYDETNYQFVKITDKNIISKYIELKNENKPIINMQEMLTKEIPQAGWKKGNREYYTEYKEQKNTLYYVWGQKYGDGKKTISGYTLYDTFEEGYTPDTNNPDTNTPDTNQNNNGNTNVPNGNTNINTNKNTNTDTTISNNKIPKAGSSVIISGIIALVIVIGLGATAKYYKYKDIK